MRIKITLPLQMAQWWVYFIILFLVNVLVILPLSGLLFHDLYSRLIPQESVQEAPFSIANELDGGKTFSFMVERIPETADSMVLLDNGMPTDIPLRRDIPYTLDLTIKAYCINDVIESNLQKSTVTVVTRGKKKNIDVFKRQVILSCFNPGDVDFLAEITKPLTLSQRIQTHFVNTFSWHEFMYLEQEVEEVRISFEHKGKGNIMVGSDSQLIYKIDFNHSLRNLMSRWRKLTYSVGIIIFDTIICSWFLLAFFICFGRIVDGEKVE